MKYFYLFFITLGLTYAEDSCKELRSFADKMTEEIVAPDAGSELLSKRFDLLKTSMGYLKQIVDMKFETATFLREHRKLYGRYTFLLESKEELSQRLDRLLKARNAASSDYVFALNSIDQRFSPLRVSQAQRKIDQMKAEENRIIDENVKNVLCRLNKMEHEYYEVLEKWAPYRDRLSQLQAIEASLAHSIEDLSTIEKHIKLFFEGTFSLIQKTTLVTESLDVSQKNCHIIHQELQKLLTAPQL